MSGRDTLPQPYRMRPATPEIEPVDHHAWTVTETRCGKFRDNNVRVPAIFREGQRIAHNSNPVFTNLPDAALTITPQCPVLLPGWRKRLCEIGPRPTLPEITHEWLRLRVRQMQDISSGSKSHKPCFFGNQDIGL